MNNFQILYKSQFFLNALIGLKLLETSLLELLNSSNRKNNFQLYIFKKHEQIMELYLLTENNWLPIVQKPTKGQDW